MEMRFLILLMILICTSCSKSTVVQSATSGNHISSAGAKSTESSEKKITESAHRTEHKKKDEPSDSLLRLYPVTIKSTYTIDIITPVILEGEESKSEKASSNAATDFLRGAMMALEKLKTCGGSFTINLVENNSNKAYPEILDVVKSHHPDLVIALVKDKEIVQYSEILGREKINFVSPVTITDSCISNPYYLQSNPGLKSYGESAAELINTGFPDYRITLINDKTTRADPLALAFLSKIHKDSLRIVDCKGKGALTQNTLKSFSPSKNVVFIPSRNEIFTSAILSQLQLDSSRETVIVGLYTWIGYSSMDAGVWNRFKVHLITPYHIDYGSTKIKTFVNTYRDEYIQEPNEWSFRGFDELLYYGTMLKKFGTYFQLHISEGDNTMLHNRYVFEQKKGCDGLKNSSLQILKFEDYRLQRVK